MARTPSEDLHPTPEDARSQEDARSPEGSQTPTTFDVLLDDLSRITVDERGTVTAVAADLIRQVRPGDRVAGVNQGNQPLDVALLARRLVAVSEGRCVLTIERDDRSEPQSPRSPWSPGSMSRQSPTSPRSPRWSPGTPSRRLRMPEPPRPRGGFLAPQTTPTSPFTFSSSLRDKFRAGSRL